MVDGTENQAKILFESQAWTIGHIIGIYQTITFVA